MPNIYIVASHMPTKMGKLIRTVTHFYYNHISFAFEKDLSDLVSFARYYYQMPLVGGYVHEGNHRMSKGIIRVMELEVSEEDYRSIQTYIQTIEDNADYYRYHLLNALLTPIHKKIHLEGCYTCEEFVHEILVKGHLIENHESSSLRFFCDKFKSQVIYEGLVENYTQKFEYNAEYERGFGLKEKVKITTKSIHELMTRRKG